MTLKEKALNNRRQKDWSTFLIFLQGLFLGVLGTIVVGLCIWPSKPEVQCLTTSLGRSDKLPNSSGMVLFIRGIRWAMFVGENDEDLDKYNLYGMTDCTSHRILLHSDLNIQNQRDTLFHEILHAGTCDESGKVHNMYYNSSNEKDHEGIYKISNYVSSVLHDNSELTLFLAGN